MTPIITLGGHLSEFNTTKLALALGKKPGAEALAFAQKKADAILRTYVQNKDFYAIWPEKRLAIACALFASILKRESREPHAVRHSPSKRTLSLIVANASDYVRVLKPLETELVAFIKLTSQYSKIRYEIKVWNRLAPSERTSRLTYVDFITTIIASDADKLESASGDENVKALHSIAKRVLGRSQKSSIDLTTKWVLKNLRFLKSLWANKFKDFADD